MLVVIANQNKDKSLVNVCTKMAAFGLTETSAQALMVSVSSTQFEFMTIIISIIFPEKTLFFENATPDWSSYFPYAIQEKKAKRPVFKLHSPMPELSEETCEDSCSLPNGTLEALETVLESNTDTCKAEVPTQCSVKQEGEVKWDAGEGETKQRKSSILSDTVLKALGLKKGEGE